MRVRMGPVKPLREKFNDRCTTVANVDFLAAQGGAVVSVAAGGFGRHAFGSNGAADGWASAARDGDGPASVFRDGGARGEGGEGEGEQVATRESVTLSAPPPPPPSRTKWTRRVPHPVLIGHAASLSASR
jgi:hypothetical protein